MNDSFNELEFLQELNNAIEEEERKALNINFADTENTQLIQNQSQANYFCKVVHELENEIKAKNELIDKEKARVENHYEQFREKQLAEPKRKLEYLKSCLKTFTIEQLEGSSKRSIKLPYGTLSLKRQNDKFEYNEEEVLNWLKENNQLEFVHQKVMESIDKNKLKKEGYIHEGVLFINNAPVDGIKVTHQEDKFEVK